jgi:hypothetical protein
VRHRVPDQLAGDGYVSETQCMTGGRERHHYDDPSSPA